MIMVRWSPQLFIGLLEETGGTINIDKLPVGDPTLSDKEIISNESQERMGCHAFEGCGNVKTHCRS